MDLTSALAVNVNVFFFFEVTMFFSVPGTSSRHCQSGGIRAHETPDLGHFPRISSFFFFKQKTAYEIGVRLVGSEMCIRDSAKKWPRNKKSSRDNLARTTFNFKESTIASCLVYIEF